MSNLKKWVIVCITTVILLGLGSFAYVYTKLDSIYIKDTTLKSEQEKEEANLVEGITNILLVGVDGRNIDKGNRSDSMMLVTIDNNSKNIKMTSIARDTYVDIPGYSTEKLTHAYAYGGIELLSEVFKINFDITIDKYVAVNFVSFMDIIDEIGGVVVNIEEKDIKEINKYIDECYTHYYNRKDVAPKEYISESGKQRLNGYQALAFSRIRYTDSAYARDNRHREVAQSAYNEFLQQSPKTYKKAADIILANTKTNISPIEMLDLAFTAYSIKDDNIEQLQFPIEGYREGKIISKSKGWVLLWDKEYNINELHKFIYGNETKTH